MKKGTFLIVFTVTLAAWGMTARAHHSFAATYEESKTVKIEGKLVQGGFRNPHSFGTHHGARSLARQEQRWAVEWGGAGQLGGQGVTIEKLKPGDVVAHHRQPGTKSRGPSSSRDDAAAAVGRFGWGTQPGQTVELTASARAAA